MTVSSSNISFILIVVLNVVQGTLTPKGNVTVDCGSAQTFTCRAPGEPIVWTTSGLSGIGRGPFRARYAAYRNPRMRSPDSGGDAQISVSSITISGFSRSDNGGTIQCINANNKNVLGMASISVELPAPGNIVAKTESCDTVTLQWTQPNDITPSVSCTPPSPGCAGCTTSPCTITGLNPSTEYVFTVTLNSVMCGTSMNTAGIGTRDLRAPANVVATVESCDTVTLQWDQPSEPNDIATSVNCIPPSPGCAECTTSPCTIAGLNPSTEYEFTVTLNSGGCRSSMNTTTATTKVLTAPTNLRATVESCNVTLQWTQPSEPNDITTSVSCTPTSPGCAKCTTSPCNITGLNPSTEYEFTVTLNSGQCRASMSTSLVRTKGLGEPTNVVQCNVMLLYSGPNQVNLLTSPLQLAVLHHHQVVLNVKTVQCTCTITGLSPSTEYNFTVTLDSRVCATSRSMTEAFKIEDSSCVTPNSNSNDTYPVGNSSAPLAALAVLVLLIPVIYPLGVLIAKYCCFRNKSYCDVFWCCGCFRKDKSPRCNSTELMKSPHAKEEVEYQNVNKGKECYLHVKGNLEHIQFVNDGEENKDQIGNNQKFVGTYETVEQLGDDDGDVVTDETLEQQGYEDWITYADLDFSGHSKGNINVVHSIGDEVTYAAVKEQ